MKDKNPLLVILVGESGAGKSTFSQAMGVDGNYYSSSKAIEDRLTAEGKPINHDTIHAFANQAYSQDPEWQVPHILGELRGKDYLILDGPRRLAEVQALIREHPNTLVARIRVSSNEERMRRLNKREGVTEQDFRRIVSDEAHQTQLNELLAMSQLVIENDGTKDEIERKAVQFKKQIEERRIK